MRKTLLALLVPLTLCNCSLHSQPNPILRQTATYPEGIKYSQYAVQDEENRIKREILSSAGVPEEKTRDLIREHNQEDVGARIEGNQYRTVVSLYLVSGEIIYTIKLYDDNNDGTFDQLPAGSKHSTEIGRWLISQN